MRIRTQINKKGEKIIKWDEEMRVGSKMKKGEEISEKESKRKKQCDANKQASTGWQ